MMACFFRKLSRAERGTSITEFGLIAPVFFVLLFGAYDVSHMVYARSVFVGAVEQAARTSALETGDTEAADAMVLAEIRPIIPGVEVKSERKSYFDFNDVAREEKFNDQNGNGTCDEGEQYVDENRSGQWDADIGVDGNGGANDVIVYTVTASYEPLFKIPFLPKTWNKRSLATTTVKKNQPFSNQVEYAADVRICTG